MRGTATKRLGKRFFGLDSGVWSQWFVKNEQSYQVFFSLGIFKCKTVFVI